MAYSIAGMQSIFEEILQQRTIMFDAAELYRDLGGNGDGISAPEALTWDQTTGLKDVATAQRYKIQSSAFADPTTADGIVTLKTAVSVQCPCVVALLLPSDFGDQVNGSGDCNGTVTGEFHQVCLIGYDDERFKFLNSFGPSWGKNGIGTLPWSFLQDPSQAGSAYAYTVSDRAEPGASPFSLRAWTAPQSQPSQPSLLESLRTLAIPRWVLAIAAVAALLIVGLFLVNFRHELFSAATARDWVVLVVALSVLAKTYGAILSKNSNNSDPLSVKYVIAFSAVLFIVLGLGAVVILCPAWETPFLISGAFVLVGGFLGLLFGYPSGVAQQTDANSRRGTTAGGNQQVDGRNKNLLAESASTLGKLLTGFTLAKLGDAEVALRRICVDMAPAFSVDPRIGSIAAAAVAAYFFFTGFLSGLLLPSYFMSGKFGE